MTRPQLPAADLRAHADDSEPLMTPESTGEERAALAAFPGIADVTVIELDAGLFKAPAAGDMDRQLDQMADARK
jgi:hypothetical protein